MREIRDHCHDIGKKSEKYKDVEPDYLLPVFGRDIAIKS
jgi:hypothetical protein